jgi:hypothetical protein
LTMFSTSSARFMCRRHASGLALWLLSSVAMAAVPPGGQRGDLERAWLHVTEALQSQDQALAHDRTDELVQVGRRLGLRRLTSYASALVIRASNEPPETRLSLLAQAAQLDPGSAEVQLALAEAEFHAGAPLAALAATVRGAVALVSDPRLANLVGPSALLALLPALLAAFGIWAFLSMRRTFARLWHDLNESGSLLRLGNNAPVFAAIVLGLPLLVAGGPVWLMLWIFALCWAYFSPLQKITGAIALIVVAATPTLMESAFNRLAHRPNAVVRATEALSERRYDPAALQELDSLSAELGSDPEFYLLQGDCYREYGLLDAAAWSYREGLRLKPGGGLLSLALGTVDYMQGDYNAALQAFDTARVAGVDPVVANYDLSLTLAQTYHFRESEAAMAEARRVDAARLRSMTDRRDQQQLIIPRFTMAQAAAMLARRDPVSLLNRGILPPPLVRERTLLHPLAIAAIVTLIIALGHFLVRERTSGLAGACIKCGRAFCRRCKLSRESQTYCTQCINIFLRKDMVAVDAQVAKRRQVIRYQRWLGLERRVADTLLPGSGLSVEGRPLLGFFLLTVAALCAATCLWWLPSFLSPALLNVTLLPFRLLAGAGWLAALVVAHFLPAERT